MSEKRFIVEYGENNLPFFVDLEEHRDMSIKEVVDLLNEMFEKLNKKQEKSVELFFKYKKLKEENERLRQSVEYWQKKYEEGTETFALLPNCDECDFLGNNGICGYCKFTLKCYDSKEDLIDGEVLPKCPLKPLINKNEQLREEIKRLEKMIWKIQWRFQQEVGIEKAREHYQEIDKEMGE